MKRKQQITWTSATTLASEAVPLKESKILFLLHAMSNFVSKLFSQNISYWCRGGLNRAQPSSKVRRESSTCTKWWNSVVLAKCNLDLFRLPDSLKTLLAEPGTLTWNTQMQWFASLLFGPGSLQNTSVSIGSLEPWILGLQNETNFHDQNSDEWSLRFQGLSEG